MNFFRKKHAAYITLEQPDFAVAAPKLWQDLLFAVEADGINHVTIRFYDGARVPLHTLSVVVSLGLKLQANTARLDLEAPTKIINTLKKMNLAAAFTRLTEAN